MTGAEGGGDFGADVLRAVDTAVHRAAGRVGAGVSDGKRIRPRLMLSFVPDHLVGEPWVWRTAAAIELCHLAQKAVHEKRPPELALSFAAFGIALVPTDERFAIHEDLARACSAPWLPAAPREGPDDAPTWPHGTLLELAVRAGLLGSAPPGSYLARVASAAGHLGESMHLADLALGKFGQPDEPHDLRGLQVSTSLDHLSRVHAMLSTVPPDRGTEFIMTVAQKVGGALERIRTA